MATYELHFLCPLSSQSLSISLLCCCKNYGIPFGVTLVAVAADNDAIQSKLMRILMITVMMLMMTLSVNVVLVSMKMNARQ